MSTIVTRAGKGSPLTHTEVDSNFTNLNTDKAESTNPTLSGNVTTTGLNFDSNTLVIDATNNRVGVGQASPAARLDLKQASDNWYSGIKLERSAATTQYGFVSSAQGTTYISAVDTAAAGNNVIVFGNSTDGTTLTERMRITSTGNVGIGTSSPSQALHVVSAQTQAKFEGSNQGNIVIAKTGTNGIGLFSNAAGTLAIYDNDAAATRLTLNSSGNIGLGVTPSAWQGGFKAFQIGSRASLASGGAYDTILGYNWYQDSGVTNRYIASASANIYIMDGAHKWVNAPSGTAGNAITFTQAMTLDASGRLAIGATSASNTLDVAASGGASFRVYDSADVGRGLEIKAGSSASGLSTIYTNTSVRALALGTNSTERMRIDSSGNLGIGTSSPNASAILDVQSTTKGVRMPNMTTTQKNAIASPAAGLMVFDTTLAKLCVYSGSAWQTITSI